MTKNQEIIVKIQGYTNEGYGVSRYEGEVVFTPRTLVGESCRVKIVKANSHLAYARLVEVLEASPARVAPDCGAYPKCGGCDLRHMSYEEELSLKLGNVREAFKRIGGFELDIDISASENILRYRNKAQFPIAGSPARYGFYRQGSHDIIACDDCLSQTVLSNRVTARVCEWMNAQGVAAYDEKSGKGIVRHCLVRYGTVCLIVTKRPPYVEQLASRLMSEFPELTGVVLNFNTSRGSVILGEKCALIAGTACAEDTLCGNRFEISCKSFYQINKPQAETLYKTAIAMTGGGDTALDLYCGIGTITLFVARSYRRVIGVEIVPEAIENAKRAARCNNVDNVEFVLSDVGEFKTDAKIDTVFADPPRAGLSDKAIDFILGLKPEKICYISCNPSTQARDIVRMHGYVPTAAHAVDLFPRTRHVETVVLMSRVEK